MEALPDLLPLHSQLSPRLLWFSTSKFRDCTTIVTICSQFQNALSTRNPGLGGGLSSGAHQSTGSLPAGQFGSNLLVGVSQRMGAFMKGVEGSGPRAAPGGVGNRGSIGGVGTSPSQMGVGGPCIASASRSIGGGARVGLSGSGGNLIRSLNSGVVLNVSSLNGSRGNIGSLSSTGGIGVQGPGRPISAILQQGVNLSSTTYSPSGDSQKAALSDLPSLLLETHCLSSIVLLTVQELHQARRGLSRQRRLSRPQQKVEHLTVQDVSYLNKFHIKAGIKLI